jgi:membrane protein
MSSLVGQVLNGRQLLGIKNLTSKRRILVRTLSSFLDNDLIVSSAAIAYFGMLVLFPTVLLITAWYPSALLRLRPFLPGSYEFVKVNVTAISHVSTGLLATAAVVLLWAGSWIFSVIERAMCRIWGTHPRRFLHGRLLTIGMMATIGLLLMGSFLITSALVYIGTAAGHLAVRPPPPLEAVGTALGQTILAIFGLVLTIILFSAIYLIMPNKKVRPIEVVPGAIIAGFLWEGAKYAFAWSIPYFHYDLLYGSIGAGVALLTWSYVSGLIMLFGAQLTAVLHCRELFGEDMSQEA